MKEAPTQNGTKLGKRETWSNRRGPGMQNVGENGRNVFVQHAVRQTAEAISTANVDIAKMQKQHTAR